jgi:hypothetical protein
MSVPGLLSHQVEVRDSIVKRCCKIPGMLLFHAVGTGKTMTALSVIMSIGNRRAIVFCPDPIKFMWDIELKKHDPKGRRGVHVLSIDEMAEVDVRDAVVVVDEVHFWIQALHDGSPSERKKAASAFDNLKGAYRRLLLTASPILDVERGMFDVACLCNLAAGRELFPFNAAAFERQFTRTNPYKAASVGWILPMLACVNKLGTLKPIINTGISLLSQATAKLDPQNKAAGGSGSGRAHEFQLKDVIPTLAMFTVGLAANHYAIAWGSGIKEMNSKAFSARAGGYCSLVTVPEESPDFPSVEVHTVRVSMTTTQLTAWMQLAERVLGEDTMKAMGIVDHGARLASTSSMQLTYKAYLHTGRRIGLLCSRDRTAPPKLEAMLKNMKDVRFKHCVVYTEFRTLVKTVKEFLEERDIPYVELRSDMSEADKSVMLTEFKERGDAVMLLDPDMYYGVSVMGAYQLHVLEPQLDLMRRQQLFGRVVRYRSHAHLPKEQRHVKIFVYCSVLGWRPVDLLARVTSKVKHYFQQNTHAFPGYALLSKQLGGKAISEALAPDSAVLALVEKAEAGLSALKKSGQGAVGGGGLSSCPEETKCDKVSERKCWSWSPDDPEPPSDDDRCNRQLHPVTKGAMEGTRARKGKK